MDNIRNVKNEITKSLLRRGEGKSKSQSNGAEEIKEQKENKTELSNISTSDSIFYSMDMTRNDALLDLPPNVPAYPKEKEVDYTCISYLSSKRKPDIYMGNEVIKARQYKVVSSPVPAEEVIKVLNKADKEEMQTVPEGDLAESSASEEVKHDYEDLKKKDVRYFTVSNITIRCYNCNEVGHISRNCPNEVIIMCIRCQQKGHNEYDCPNIKCFRCNKIGHKSFECKMRGKDILKCENCQNIGHEALDCLVEPLKLKRKQLKEQTCYFCSQKGHAMCPLNKSGYVIEDYYSDEVVLTESEPEAFDSDEDFHTIISKASKKTKTDSKESKDKETSRLVKKKRSRIFNKLDNRDIKSTVFCPKCAEMHSKDDCNVQLRFNSFDQRRQIYSKTLFRNNRDDDNRNGNNTSRGNFNKYNKY
jgi:hypothetical protein